MLPNTKPTQVGYPTNLSHGTPNTPTLFGRDLQGMEGREGLETMGGRGFGKLRGNVGGGSFRL